MHLKKTVIEGKKKLDISEFYEIQLWDMRSPDKSLFKSIVSQRSSYAATQNNPQWCWKAINFVKPIIGPMLIISSLSLLILLVFILDSRIIERSKNIPCEASCKIKLVESIPENVTYPDGSPLFQSTFSSWKTLLDDATSSIDLAVFYWSLKNEDVTPRKMASAWQGEAIFQQLRDIGKRKDVKIRIAQNAPTHQQPQTDSKILEQEGVAEVRSLNFNKLVGAGVLHTKMWIVDGVHMYLGSANMDWQSLTQVKEVGVLVQDCACLVQDVAKIFEVYWILGNSSEVPSSWPVELDTKFNVNHTMNLDFSDSPSNVFVSSSPMSFNPTGRTNDIDAILSIIRAANKFVYIAVMDYFPRSLYSKHNTFWPIIDNELRRAAYERGVEVRLLASHWKHTRKDMVWWLKSLQDLSGDKSMNIQAKLFVVPAYTDDQKALPYARVNHNKYLITDKTAYIGTSNWSEDYFINTAGISLSISEDRDDSTDQRKTLKSREVDEENQPGRAGEYESSLRMQLVSLFQRDWNSTYATPLEQFWAP